MDRRFSVVGTLARIAAAIARNIVSTALPSVLNSRVWISADRFALFAWAANPS
jgi:hypothetical protein